MGPNDILRRNAGINVFSITLNYLNHHYGGWGHQHDGFLFFVGKHHSYRKFVADYTYRPPGQLTIDMSY
eukprot:5228318-Ditylum_brightwellii.AAC.1